MHTKLSSRKSSVLISGPVLLVLGALFTASPAQAGFQWIAPNAPVAPDSIPTAMVDPQTLPPIPTLSAPTPAPAPIKAPVAAPTVPEKPLDQGAPVRGFANKVPLSVALRQVLPPEVGYSLAQDVSLGTVVSWKGDAPWREVMKNMLSPAGLSFKEQGGLVSITRAEGTGALVPNTFPPVPPQPSASGSSPSIVSAPAPVSLGKPMSLGPQPSLAPATTLVAPTALVAPEPVRSDVTVDSWSGNKGDTLQATLEAWCKRANIELSWQAEYDYPMQASVSLSGSFEEAVRGLLAGFQDASPQPVGFLHNNQTAGQTVLVIQVRGNSYNE